MQAPPGFRQAPAPAVPMLVSHYLVRVGSIYGSVKQAFGSSRVSVTREW